MSGRRIIAVGLLAGLMASAAGGCVSKEQFDKAVAASRRANEALQK
ncbi:hypothetical protein LCGC14_2485600, partial [marine sediment metagenome]